MKTNILFIAILGFLIVSGCSKDEDPKADVILNPATDLEITAGHELVDVAWTAPSEGTVLGYVLSLSPDNGDSPISLDKSETFVAIKGLTNGQEYNFDLKVDYGDDGISNKLAGTGTPVDQLNFNAFAGSESILCQWSKPDRDDIAGYNLKVSPGELEFDLDASATSKTVAGLDNDVEYTAVLTIKYTEGTGAPVQQQATPGFIEMFLADTLTNIDTELSFAYNPVFNQDIASYSWDFNGESTGTNADEKYTFTSAGKKVVTLEVTDDEGNKFSSSKDVHVIGVNWAFVSSTHIKGSMATRGDDGTLYIGNSDGNFYAINPDGTQKWVLNFAGGEIYDTAPSIGSDGTIYVTSQNGNLYAVDPAGTTDWTFAAESGMRSSAALASDGTIYINDRGGKFYAVNPNGTQKWDFAHAGGGDSSPVVASDGTIYFGSDDTNLYALNPDGTMKWNYTAGDAVDSSPVIGADGTIYFGAKDNKFYAVTSEGNLSWTFDLNGERTLGAAVIGSDGTIYIGGRDKALYALSPSGTLVWSITDFSKRFLFSAATLDANGYLYIGNENGSLYAINQATGDILWELVVGKIFSSVTIGTEGNIYVGTLVDTDVDPDARFLSVYGVATQLADSPWPTKRFDAQGTGRQQ